MVMAMVIHGRKRVLWILVDGPGGGYDLDAGCATGQDCERGHPSHRRHSDDGHGRSNFFFAQIRGRENDRPSYHC